MLDISRVTHVLKFVLPSVLVVWLFIHLGREHAHDKYSDLFRPFRAEKAVFVDDFLRHEVDGDFDGASLAELCSNKTWMPGLLLSCDAVVGGLGETKNGQLNCLRVAVEMGAELVLPDIVERSLYNVARPPRSNGPLRGVPLDYLFDRSHLEQSLADFCPQLKVHRSLNSFYDNPDALVSLTFDLFQVSGLPLAGNMPDRGARVVDNMAVLGPRIHTFLDNKRPRRDRPSPFHVHLKTPLFALPAYRDPLPLQAHLGRLFRVRSDVRRLAAAALFNMQKAFDLKMDLRQGLQPGSTDQEAEATDDIGARDNAGSADVSTKAPSFVAVEILTERGIGDRFPSYADQASDALQYAIRNNASVVYLAQGATADDAAAFADRAHDFGIAVVTAADLVEGSDADALSGLTWDQYGLVDYEIMMRAGLVAGNELSSLAWNLALRRQNAFGAPGRSDAGHLNGTSVRWHDQYSTIFGRGGLGENMRRSIWA